jgi:[protein-PII] uridylyltransferase
LSHDSPEAIVAERARIADEAVRRAADRFLNGVLPPYSVVAVGGYGRRELFPYSDVDLLLLLAAEAPAADIKEPLGAFLRELWDAGFRASQSVRTISDCLRLHDGNLELTISLLDRRWVAGDREPFAALEDRFPAFLKSNGAAVLRGLARLVEVRHAKFENTVQHLEPDIKEGPGGIRDLHFLDWSARLAPGKEPLLEAQAAAVESRPFFYRLRTFLHEANGRDNNRLTFELQDRAAETLAAAGTTPEEWMRVYYRHARSTFRAATRALDFLGAEDSSLIRQFFDLRGRRSTGDFTVAQNRVYLRNPAITLAAALSAFEVFVYVARHGIPLASDTERRLAERASVFASDALSWSSWRELLALPHAALAVRALFESGVLPVLIPVWQALECLVVRDYYHRYTVDEHTLVTLDVIDQLCGAPQASSSPKRANRLHELAEEVGDLATLRFALLLHDVGKGTAPGGHVSGSLVAARDLMRRYSIPAQQEAEIEFLIANHLILSSAMKNLDPEDPATARQLTAAIPTLEDLRRLTLLTYADIAAVHPTAMSQWRAEQLWHLYSVTAAQFARELGAARIHAEEGGSDFEWTPPVAQFLEGLPTRYVRTHSAAQIRAHFALDQQRRRTGVGVSVESRGGGLYLLTVVAPDESGLFARICGALASFGMNIRKAEAASNAARSALDEFYFEDPSSTLELNPEEIERLKRTMEAVVRGALEVSDLLKRRRPLPRPRNAPHVLPVVRFDNDASELATLIHFTGEDRPGLLFALASSLTAAGCNIEVVLVTTEAHRALDVFYVNRGGSKLAADEQEHLRQNLIGSVLSQ